MRAGTKRWAVATLALLLGGCAVEAERDLGDGPTPVDTISIRGRDFVPLDMERELRNGPLARYLRTETSDDGRASEWLELPPAAEMTEEELAYAVRPVTILGGQSYIAAEPSWEAAAEMAMARSGAWGDASSFSYEGAAGDGGVDEGFTPEGPTDEAETGPVTIGCCGTDDRTAIRNNTAWPWATVMASMVPVDRNDADWFGNTQARECTWQLVGRSTALAAAHCFYYTDAAFNRWIPVDTLRWGAAPDGQDNPTRPIPAGYPWGQDRLSGYTYPTSDGSTYGTSVTDSSVESFQPFVTWAWVSGPDGVIEWDFAVIDFRDGSSPNPGTTAGWMGWGVYSDAQLDRFYIHAGVPKVDFADDPIPDNRWPQIMYGFTSMATVGPYWIDYRGDCSGGDSGSGIWAYIDSGWRVVGITHGYSTTSSGEAVCVARRLDTTYWAFMRDTSEF